MGQWDEVFSNLRRTPFNDDPNGIPQEGRVGNGRIDSQGYLSDNSVTSDVIRTDAVIARHITANTIDASKIVANTITAAQIAANTITAAQIAADTITAAQIAANAITVSELAANSVTAAKIVANTITATEIAASTITATEIAADTITANKIAASAITASEIAADAVTTTKILAANVTASRITVDIAGKTFGANDGSSGAPGLYFDAATTTGIYRNGSSGLSFDVVNVPRLKLDNAASIVAYGLIEKGSTGLNLGRSTNRWDTVFCITLDQSSDERLKQDIADAPLGLDFVRSLKPRVFRWRDTADTQAQEIAEANYDRDAVEAQTAPLVRRIENSRAEQMTLPANDPKMARLDASIERARDEIAAISEHHTSGVREAQQAQRTGQRLHYGLIAQEVKTALDEAGVDSMDAAFWHKNPEGEQSLSYSELMIPLLRAVQELAVKVEALSSS